MRLRLHAVPLSTVRHGRRKKEKKMIILIKNKCCMLRVYLDTILSILIIHRATSEA